MKSIFTICLVMFMTFGLSYGQSPRLVLSEEFTGETCGPCATNNPGYNSIMEGFAGQVISLKYQNNIPSSGPNFYTYNTGDISSRTSYYANSYSPHAFIDGNFWNGNAGAVTASQFTTRTAVTSPFEITATHSFSAAYDSIFAHIVIRATAASSIATLKARVAISERNVYGYTSPNGESDYAHVMRKLLPTAAGTSLPATMAVGDSMVFDVQWKILVSTNPAVSLPLWPMLEVIAWVQNDGNKEILQAGHSPAMIAIDPAMVSMSGVTTVSCLDSIAPSVTITNNEPTPATSIDFEYSLDGLTPMVYSWTGTLNQGATAIVSIPPIAMATGPHALNVKITNVNGTPDLISTNNMVAKPAGRPTAAVTTFTENFVSTTWPPVNWLNENPGGLTTTGWSRATAGVATTGSAKMNFYSTPASANVRNNTLYPLSPLDLSTVTGSLYLTFSVAHQRYSASYTDRLDVIVSTNCGATWTTAYTKSGANLATVAAFGTAAFTPSSTQWRTDAVDLAAYIGNPNVLIAFKGVSGYGNNAYVDNINLSTSPVGIQEHPNMNFGFDVLPNPVTADNGTILISLKKNANVRVEVLDIMGHLVSQASQVMLSKGEHSQPLNLQGLANGLYLVRLNVDGEQLTRRVVLQQ